ncbi:MAG: glycoside hydrolase family 2 [Chloroflexi bacterium]|nr:MAG: glycoside hydrolase family 2 [Chloroflexota bacterium]
MIGLALAPKAPRGEYPRPLLRRRDWVNLNGEWEFGAGEKRVFDRTITVPFCPQSELSGVGQADIGDVVWYRRTFDAPPAERLLLHFGAVDYRATVWVNGEEVAAHEGGHTPFTADISRVARDRDNEIVVRVEDPLADRTIPRGKQYWSTKPESIFYTASTGIWQTVWLEPLPERSIAGLRIDPEPHAGAVAVHIETEGRKSVSVALHGEEVGHWSGTQSSCRIELAQPALWSPETPNLYSVEVTLHDRAGRHVDHVSSHFGLRTLEARDGKFLLNGEPYFQRLILDQGYFPGGLLTAARDGDLRRDIELAKSLGFNGARKHQKIEDPRWLYWADRLGFLVWEEMPSFHQHSAEAERRLATEWEEAVRRDRGHACIVAWVPMNESFGLQSVEPDVAARFLDGLYHFTHDIDGTRPVISNDGWEHTHTDMCTLHDYNPAHALKRRYSRLYTALDAAAHPKPLFLPGYEYGGEPLLVTEFGGIALAHSGGFGWSVAGSVDELVETYREMVEALTQPGPVEGFGYTQLTDVELERNGLLTFDREPKADPDVLREITELPKR